jgi:RES domain-containing protein
MTYVADSQVRLDLGPRPAIIWRLDTAERAEGATAGLGAKRYGGRWNPRGLACVYASLDAATAIMEVAVHTGFDALDARPHVLTAMALRPDVRMRVVRPEEIPNPNWLVPGSPTPGQVRFGGELLRQHPVVLIPSVAAQRSWNVLVNPELEADVLTVLMRERLRLDPRLAIGAAGG